MIVKTTQQHRAQLLAIIEANGQFDADGLAYVASTLDAYLANSQEAIWLTALTNAAPVGVAYCAPEPVTDGTWNLLMLWLQDGFEGKGFAQALVAEIENELRARNARLLLVETSQLPDFERARKFYKNYGFQLEAEVKDFFAAGDNKLIYTKALARKGRETGNQERRVVLGGKDRGKGKDEENGNVKSHSADTAAKSKHESP